MSRARILADYVSSGDELADKAPLASPAFTGTPTGITAAHLEAGVLPSDVTGGSGLTNGVTNSVTWRLIANEPAGQREPIGVGGAGKWELADDTESEFYLGSAGFIVVDTGGNGVFSFTASGYYSICASVIWDTGATIEQSGLKLQGSNNGVGGSFGNLATANNTVYKANRHGQCVAGTIIKVGATVADFAIRLTFITTGGTSFAEGHDTMSKTYITFTKLADL